jgi:RNA polymerase sigma factor (sigma-70 family)
MAAQPEVDWAAVVSLVECGDPHGEEILYRNLAGGARYFLQRRLGVQDVEDRVHDLFVTIVETIRRGEIRQPERLMGFVRTLLHRQLSVEIGRNVKRRATDADLDTAAEAASTASTPEERAIAQQRVELMKRVLRELSERDFEVLTRFYIREQTPTQICVEMGLTQVQFQLLKSRAKARFSDLMQRTLERGRTSRE